MKISVLKITLWVFLGIIFLGLFLPMLLASGALVGGLLFGWLSFLRRVWPGVTANWNGIGMVILCSVLIVGALHSFGGWLFASVAARVNSCAGVRWRWSWTLALYAGVWLLFAAIMGAVGAAHQIGWLLRSDEPFYKPRRYLGMLQHPLRDKAVSLFYCADESGWNLELTRKAFFEGEARRSRSDRNLLEEFHVVFVEGTNGSLAAGFIFHRDPDSRAKAGFAVVKASEQPGEISPIEELAAALAQHQSQTNIVVPGLK